VRTSKTKHQDASPESNYVEVDKTRTTLNVADMAIVHRQGITSSFSLEEELAVAEVLSQGSQA
jgi:hypothetical protein